MHGTQEARSRRTRARRLLLRGLLTVSGVGLGTGLAIATAGGKVMVDDARVVAADVMATNGVIHVIDKVLMP